MRVLLIEDDAVWAERLGSLLREQGWTVARAESGEAALHTLREQPLPDLILLDLVLPGMDGWTFYRHLRTTEEWSALPVMIVSTAGVPDLPLRSIVASLRKGEDHPRVLAEVRAELLRWKSAQRPPSPGPFQLTIPADMQQILTSFPESISRELHASLQNAAQLVAHELPLTSTWLQAISGGPEPTLMVRVDDYRAVVQLQPARRMVTVIAVLSPKHGWRGLA